MPLNDPGQTFTPEDVKSLEVLKKTDPVAFAKARAFEIRRRLSFEMTEIVKNPAAYSNRDVLDILRDAAKEKGLQFFIKRDKNQPRLIHCYIRDPIVEPYDPRPVPKNNTWLGWVEKNTNPTPDLGGDNG